jgi:hypothetical protein
MLIFLLGKLGYLFDAPLLTSMISHMLFLRQASILHTVAWCHISEFDLCMVLWYNLGSVSDATPCFLSTEHVLHSLWHLDVVVVVVVVLNGLQTLR